jgi:hypothetical protein
LGEPLKVCGALPDINGMYAIGGVSHHVCEEPGWRVLSRVDVIAEGLDILSRYPFEIQFHQYDHLVLLDSQPGQASKPADDLMALLTHLQSA